MLAPRSDHHNCTSILKKFIEEAPDMKEIICKIQNGWLLSRSSRRDLDAPCLSVPLRHQPSKLPLSWHPTRKSELHVAPPVSTNNGDSSLIRQVSCSTVSLPRCRFPWIKDDRLKAKLRRSVENKADVELFAWAPSPSLLEHLQESLDPLPCRSTLCCGEVDISSEWDPPLPLVEPCFCHP